MADNNREQKNIDKKLPAMLPGVDEKREIVSGN
jgi:hypothetical protein